MHFLFKYFLSHIIITNIAKKDNGGLWEGGGGKRYSLVKYHIFI